MPRSSFSVCPPGEDEEDRLERIVGFVPLAENAPARSVHERAVPADEGREGVLVALGQESRDEARIEVALVRPHPAVEYFQQGCIRHRPTPTRRIRLGAIMSICPPKSNRSSKIVRGLEWERGRLSISHSPTYRDGNRYEWTLPGLTWVEMLPRLILGK